MRTTLFRKMAVFVAGGLLGFVAASVQGAETTRLPNAESYINAEESHWVVRGQEATSQVSYDVASATIGDGGSSCSGDSNCDSGCGDRCGFPSGGCCADCCRRGWFGGGEILFLKPFESEGASGADFNYRSGFRGWIGVQREDGLGVRLTGFDYFQRSGTPQTTQPRRVLDINSLDAEVIDSFNICNWNLMVGGGIRYLSFRDDFVTSTTTGAEFHGLGPVISVQITRAVNENWSVYGIAREALLFGNSNFSGGATTRDTTGFVSELQAGLQYNRVLSRGGIGFARFGWEGQYYSAMGGDSQDVSLIGGVMSIGLMR